MKEDIKNVILQNMSEIENEIDRSEQEDENDNQKQRDKKKSRQKRSNKNAKMKKSLKIYIFLLCIAVATVTFGVYLMICTVSIGASSAEQAYQKEMTNSKDKAFVEKEQYAHKISRDIAESKNHVKNRVLLDVGKLQEINNLEVLQVFEAKYEIEKAEENQEKNEAWLKLVGKGVFIVDLTSAEFIFDEENQHVIARIQKPKLDKSHFEIIEEEKMLFKNDKLGNGSISDGEQLYFLMKERGSEAIYESLVSNQDYSEKAEESAKLIIINLIKTLNPQFDNLNVDVQF